MVVISLSFLTGSLNWPDLVEGPSGVPEGSCMACNLGSVRTGTLKQSTTIRPLVKALRPFPSLDRRYQSFTREHIPLSRCMTQGITAP